MDLNGYIKGPSSIIGKPSDCTKAEVLENSNHCKVYCCRQNSLDLPAELETSIYNERTQRQTHNKTKILNLDKNRISKPFHSNNIDKQMRQRRDTDDWTDKDNIFDTLGSYILLDFDLNRSNQIQKKNTASYILLIKYLIFFSSRRTTIYNHCSGKRIQRNS